MAKTKTAEAAQLKALQSSLRPWWSGLLLGLALTFAIAGVATWLHTLPGLSIFSPLILAILLGMAVRNTVGTPAACQLGVTFSLKKILKLAIVMLGLQLSIAQVAEVGVSGLLVVSLTLIATFTFTVWLGNRLGVDKKLAELIAAGTSICGASAVIATNVVTEGSDEDVAYAVAMVTVFGSMSMFLYPSLPNLLHLDPRSFGLWTGASIHEIAQVIAAAFQDGQTSGQFATISKLSRVMLLAPVVLTLGVISARRKASGGRFDWRSIPIPYFVLGFIAVIGLNSLNILPTDLKALVIGINQFLLAVSLAAMGLETSIAKLRAKGTQPFLLGGGAWIFISVFSYGLVKLIHP